MVITAKDVKNFLKDVPNDADVYFNNGNITVIFNHTARALNTWGATWENGVGYPPDGTSCCGECTHFDCSICGKERTTDENNSNYLRQL